MQDRFVLGVGSAATAAVAAWLAYVAAPMASETSSPAPRTIGWVGLAIYGLVGVHLTVRFALRRLLTTLLALFWPGAILWSYMMLA